MSSVVPNPYFPFSCLLIPVFFSLCKTNCFLYAHQMRSICKKSLKIAGIFNALSACCL